MKKVLVVFLIIVIAACQPGQFGAREKGALAGAATGAGLGAVIGHGSGHTGEGIAIGSAVGALAGGLLGHQKDVADERYEQREQQIARQERMLEENRRIIAELKKRGADVRVTDRGVVVNIPDVLFGFDKCDLTREAQETSLTISSTIKEYPERRIAVEGHTDSVGTIAYNQRLSECRARTVADELVAQGISRRRIRTEGFGETDPIASNRTEAGRKRNRRVEVIIENREARDRY